MPNAAVGKSGVEIKVHIQYGTILNDSMCGLPTCISGTMGATNILIRLNYWYRRELSKHLTWIQKNGELMYSHILVQDLLIGIFKNLKITVTKHSINIWNCLFQVHQQILLYILAYWNLMSVSWAKISHMVDSKLQSRSFTELSTYVQYGFQQWI